MQQQELTLKSSERVRVETDLSSVAMALAFEEQPAGWEIVTSSSSTRVAYCASMNLYYKEFLSRSPVENIRAALRGSRCTRARVNSEKLIAAGFPAPENVAWGDLPGNREYLFTRAMPGRGVSDWLANSVGGQTREGVVQKRRLLVQLGHFIGTLHASGCIHGDLRICNILAQASDNDFDFTLLDNDSTTFHRLAPGKLILKNLMQLNLLTPNDVTITDRWRFFHAWHKAMPHYNTLEARVLALEAYRWAMRRLGTKGRL